MRLLILGVGSNVIPALRNQTDVSIGEADHGLVIVSSHEALMDDHVGYGVWLGVADHRGIKCYVVIGEVGGGILSGCAVGFPAVEGVSYSEFRGSIV